MDLKVVAKYIGLLVLAEAVFMLPAAAAGLVYQETSSVRGLLASAAICLVLGLALYLPFRRHAAVFYAREGFVVAGGGWLLVSLLGALPFLLGGGIPNFPDAFFESASGFTTTGASILADAGALSRGLLFWRSFTHWMGGIGVLAFILAVVRSRAGAGFTVHLLRAETPGPQKGKLMPKTSQSVRTLFLMYGGLSALNLAFLLAGGMPPFDALCTMFGTAGTGGFGIRADSMASYSPYLQAVTGVFMALFGVNFGLYFLLLHRQWRAVLRDEELRLYIGVLAVAIAAVALSLLLNGQTAGYSLGQAAFAVVSVMTTTGYASADFNMWPQFCRTMLLLVMLCGGMAGSTAGGFKLSRLLILAKGLRAGVYRLAHPHSVRPVMINGRVLDDGVVSRTTLFLVSYFFLLLGSILVLSLDGHAFETSLTAVLSCLNNVGPGLDAVGPTGNYSLYSPWATLFLTILMLLGRLEIFPIVMLVLPSTWRRKG